ncbi:MAG: NYN domain-containing protein, partial [Clostridia bacterium]
KGKNTSDMSLTIQAMEILFERPHINAFVIVSSDSDYIRLVLELKERDKQVIGLGMRSAIEAYKNSYTEFIYLDEEVESSRPQTTTRPQHKKVKAPEAVVVDPKPVVKTDEKQTSFEEIVDLLIDEKGKAYYSQIGIDMKNKYPDFVPQNYGVNSPKKLIKLFADKVGKYEVKTGEDKTSLYLVRKSI